MYGVRVGKIKNIFFSLKVGLDRKLGSLPLGDNVYNKHVYQNSHNEMIQSKIISFCLYNSVVRRPHVCYKLCNAGLRDTLMTCVTAMFRHCQDKDEQIQFTLLMTETISQV